MSLAIHKINTIPGIHIEDTQGGCVITTECGFKLVANKTFRPLLNKHVWNFDEQRSRAPTRVEHFELRKQIHECLNPKKIFAEKSEGESSPTSKEAA